MLLVALVYQYVSPRLTMMVNIIMTWPIDLKYDKFVSQNGNVNFSRMFDRSPCSFDVFSFSSYRSEQFARGHQS